MSALKTTKQKLPPVKASIQPRALLDVNVLIALLDPEHAASGRAHQWLAANKGGVATCPIVQNGVVRILSQPAYSKAGQFSVASVVQLLRDFCAAVDHQFWPDALALIDEKTFDESRLRGHRQITDAYLLALAAANGGVLLTFDAAITTTLSAVREASADAVQVL